MRAIAVLFACTALHAQKPIRLGIGTWGAGDAGQRVGIPCGNRLISTINDGGNHAGVGVMDITVPATPTRLNSAFLTGAKETDAKAFAVSADCSTAYMGPLGDGTAPELTVWDVSAVDATHAPVVKATLALGSSGNSYWAQPYTSGGSKYVWVDVDDTNPRVYLVDVTNTSSPSIVSINGGSFYTAATEKGLTSFEVRGTVLYGCNESSGGRLAWVTRIDFSNPASLSVANLQLSAGETNCKGFGLSYPYGYAIVGSGAVTTLDMSTTPITRLRSLATSQADGRHPGVLGNWMIVPTLGNPCLVVAINLKTPSTPTELGTLSFNSGENSCRFIAFNAAAYAYVVIDLNPATTGIMTLAGSRWVISQ